MGRHFVLTVTIFLAFLFRYTVSESDSLDRSYSNVDGNVILWWTPFTGMEDNRICDLGSCFFTEDRTFFHRGQVKAVLFYGSDFSVEDLPLPRDADLWWGLLHEESPKNQPLFDHQSVLELFNCTATFRRSSSFPLTLQHLSSLEDLTSLKNFVPTKEKSHLIASNKLSPVVYIQSDCDTPAERDEYVKELSKYIQVDSYGACLHNKDLPQHLQDPAETYDHQDLRSLIGKYKFAIAVENAACDDYITEKLWRPLTVGAVPIYWGSPSFRDWSPNPNSVIYVSDFNSPKDLALYLYKLLHNDTLYESHLEHKLTQIITNKNLVMAMKTRKWGINNDYEKGNFIEHFECYVCNRILEEQINVLKMPKGEFQADTSHYGCPEPPTVLTGQPNHKSFWVEQWHKAQVEAMVLKRLILTPPGIFTSDIFYQEVIDDLQKGSFFQKFTPEHIEL